MSYTHSIIYTFIHLMQSSSSSSRAHKDDILSSMGDVKQHLTMMMLFIAKHPLVTTSEARMAIDKFKCNHFFATEVMIPCLLKHINTLSIYERHSLVQFESLTDSHFDLLQTIKKTCFTDLERYERNIAKVIVDKIMPSIILYTTMLDTARLGFYVDELRTTPNDSTGIEKTDTCAVTRLARQMTQSIQDKSDAMDTYKISVDVFCTMLKCMDKELPHILTNEHYDFRPALQDNGRIMKMILYQITLYSDKISPVLRELLKCIEKCHAYIEHTVNKDSRARDMFKQFEKHIDIIANAYIRYI